MPSRVILFSFTAAVCLLLAGSSAATNLVPNGVWNVVADQNMCNGCFFPETWVTTSGGTVFITDLFVVGDSYDVYINGIKTYTTPAVPDWTSYGSDPYGWPYTTDPNGAYFLDAGIFSGITFPVTAGESITLEDNSLPSTFTDGTYAIAAIAPEPGSILLLASGLAGLAGVLRRKLR